MLEDYYMKIVSLKCPDCGANLSVDAGREFCFCQYCGAKVILNNENEKVYRHVDDAKIKQAEVERQVRMRELEIEEKESASDIKRKKLKFVAAMIAGLIGIAMIVADGISGHISLMSTCGMMLLLLPFFIIINSISDDPKKNRQANSQTADGMINFPDLLLFGKYRKMSYSAVEVMLRDAGFTEIKCVPLNDLPNGFVGDSNKAPNLVSKIAVNGSSEAVFFGSRFKPDAKISIYYHSYISAV